MRLVVVTVWVKAHDSCCTWHMFLLLICTNELRQCSSHLAETLILAQQEVFHLNRSLLAQNLDINYYLDYACV